MELTYLKMSLTICQSLDCVDHQLSPLVLSCSWKLHDQNAHRTHNDDQIYILPQTCILQLRCKEYTIFWPLVCIPHFYLSESNLCWICPPGWVWYSPDLSRTLSHACWRINPPIPVRKVFHVPTKFPIIKVHILPGIWKRKPSGCRDHTGWARLFVSGCQAVKMSKNTRYAWSHLA